MQYAQFDGLIERIYGTFGRNQPTTAQKALIFDRCRDIPDEAAGWIADRVCDEAALPGNMGRALYRGWLDWLAAHPERVVQVKTCGQCDDGWLWCWREHQGRSVQFVTPCPVCRAQTPGVKSLMQLEREGVAVMPAGYAGGPLGFDRDNGFGVLWRDDAAPHNAGRN